MAQHTVFHMSPTVPLRPKISFGAMLTVLFAVVLVFSTYCGPAVAARALSAAAEHAFPVQIVLLASHFF